MIHTLLSLDERFFTLINGHHGPLFDLLFSAITFFGDGWVAIPIVAAIIVIKTPRRILARTLVCAAVAGTISGVLNTQIKHAVHRDRPVVHFAKPGCPHQTEVHVVGTPLRRNSFPSGHTNTAFTAAAILALLFGGWFYAGYVLALCVGLSRIYIGAHFPLDVLGGAVLGTLIAAMTIAIFHWRNPLPCTILKSTFPKKPEPR